MQQLIIDLILAIVSVVRVTREELAKDLTEIADKIANGGIVPDSALKKSEKDLDKTKDILNSLPK